MGKTVKVLSVVTALVMLAGVAPAEADPTPLPVSTCIEGAHEVADGGWTCAGSLLTFRAEGGSGEWVTEDTGTVAASAPIDAVPMAADPGPPNYETWCETMGTCHFIRTDYIAESKANIWWGVGKDTKGTFDLIVRTSLNGRSQRFVITLDHDSGPALTVDPLLSVWKDQTFDSRLYVVSGLPTMTIRPRKYETVPGVKPVPTNKPDDYYGRIDGDISAAGYPGVSLSIPPFRTQAFNCPSGSGNCKFP